jgi:glycosyltransferase involved in cell wall biosynthesis
METSLSTNYVLVTPAKNEDAFIGSTIHSVVNQTILPELWIIVNDGSTDKTRKIVESYQKEYSFIKLVNLVYSGKRNFGSKASAFKKGLKHLNGVNYGFIGNLDADIEIIPNYYEKMLKALNDDYNIGIVGGSIYTLIGNKYISVDKTADSVAGAVQFFRKECFEDIGGYPKLEIGGIDSVAEIKAKMLGWKVRKIKEVKVKENRRTGSANFRPIASKIQEGKRFYSVGYCPIFYFFRCLYRLPNPPIIIGSIASLIGYFYSYLKSEKVSVSNDIVVYLRNTQRRKLVKMFSINFK